MKRPFKHGIQDHFYQFELNHKQQKQLQQLQREFDEKPAKTPIFFLPGIFALMLVVSISVFFNTSLISTSPSLTQFIAQEAASNHLKQKPLEIKTSDISEIRNYFTELDFLPATPDFLTSGQQQLLGGRYCSIQGVTAAQLRLQADNQHPIQTLYEVEYDPVAFPNLPRLEANQSPVIEYAKGIKVKIWVEKDILFVLTAQDDL